MPSRRQIRDALVDRLKSHVSGIRYWSTSPETFDDVKQKPALVLVTEEHRPSTEMGLPTIWTAAYTARIFAARPGSRETSPDDQLDDFLDSVSAALMHHPPEPFPEPGPTDFQTTLGGKCHRAWISAPVSYGTLEGDSFLDVPIEVDFVEGA